MFAVNIFLFSICIIQNIHDWGVQAVVGKCNYELMLLWSRETGHVPFAAAPIISDINLDGQPEVIAAPFADQITVVQGHDGQPLPKGKWPQQLVESTVHASPMTYDVDNDGKPDVIILTTDGHFHFYDWKGKPLENTSFKLPGLQISKTWHTEALTVEHTEIHKYILDSPTINDKADDGYVSVDPHVLGSAVIADVNADNVIEEMVIPVSYFFRDEVYNDEDVRAAKGVDGEDLNKFLAGGIVLFNLTSLSIIRTSHLELTRLDAEYPGYVMFTPTVVDLDGNHGGLEIVVGTSAGQIHAIGLDGISRAGWPISRDPIHGQILVADIDLDGKMDIVAMDTSSNVMCYQSDGQVSWETTISGTNTNGPRVADIEQDGKLDVIIGTNDGHVWILDGTDGKVKKQWPFRVGKGLGATPLITQLNLNSVIDVVILGEDSHLHIISGDGKKCRHAVSLGTTSLVGILSYDLVPSAPGMELLVATRDGNLMCLGRRTPVHIPRSKVVLDGVPAETRSANDFVYSASSIGIVLRENIIGALDVTGTSLDVYFTIHDTLPTRGQANTYKVNIYLGNERKATSRYERPGSYYLTITSPTSPTQGLIRVVMTTRHGIIYQDSATLQFNVSFLKDLKWLLACPFIAMTSVLLLIYGYPAADLLPVTHRNKAR